MLIAHSVEELAFLAGVGVTIGNFDGVHLGHQALIRQTMETCRQAGLACVLVTFWPHPRMVVAPHKPHSPLTSREERLRLLQGLGIPHVLELPFDQALADLSPREFIERCLLPMQLRHLVVGYDFTLGKGRSGHADVLRELGLELGFSVTQLSPVIGDDAVVSSTRLRDYISRGDVWQAARLLGRPYSITGPVVHGEGRGSGLGFPTANLLPPETLLPAEGVYATRVYVDGLSHASVTNVGRKPTFDGTALGVESFLLDADMNLYDRQIRLEFVARLRGEQCFASVQELTRQVRKDVAEARGLLAHGSGQAVASSGTEVMDDPCRPA